MMLNNLRIRLFGGQSPSSAECPTNQGLKSALRRIPGPARKDGKHRVRRVRFDLPPDSSPSPSTSPTDAPASVLLDTWVEDKLREAECKATPPPPQDGAEQPQSNGPSRPPPGRSASASGEEPEAGEDMFDLEDESCPGEWCKSLEKYTEDDSSDDDFDDEPDTDSSASSLAASLERGLAISYSGKHSHENFVPPMGYYAGAPLHFTPFKGELLYKGGAAASFAAAGPRSFSERFALEEEFGEDNELYYGER